MTTLRALERSHRALSPSNFARVSKCTMSHRLTATSGRAVAGDAALLGTAAHSLARVVPRVTPGAQIRVETVCIADRRFTVDARMRDSVQVALDWVASDLAGRQLLIEHQVKLPWGRITGWVDVATVDEPFVIADFKHGYAVVGGDAPQLGLYLSP